MVHGLSAPGKRASLTGILDAMVTVVMETAEKQKYEGDAAGRAMEQLRDENGFIDL